MFHQLYAYLLFGTSSTVLLSLLAIYVRESRQHPASDRFCLFVSSLAIWSLSDVLELMGPTEEWCRYWFATIRTSAVLASAATWIWFCLVYANWHRTLWGRSLALVATILSAALATLSWTPWRNLLYAELSSTPHKWLWYPAVRRIGPLFDAYFYFSLICCGTGLALLCVFLYLSSPKGRQQILILIVAIAFPASLASLNDFEVLGTSSIDKSVFAFPVTVFLLVFALFRRGFMRSTPISLQALTNSLPDAILVLDHQSFISEANERGLQLLTEHRQDKRHPSSILHRKADQAVGANTKLLDFFSSLQPGRHELRLSLDHQTPRVYTVQVSPLIQTSLPGTLVAFRDETQLYQLLEDLETYATTVSHDLRNPLTTITIFSELLASAETLDDLEVPPRELGSRILQSAQSMRAIIRDLLIVGDLERQDSSALESIDLHSICERLAERYHQLHSECSIRVEGENCGLIQGHPTWIEMIVSNLLQNAIEHSHAGKGEIVLRCTKQGEELIRLSISDNGEGMDSQTQKNLFRPECKKSTEQNGHPRGFGLSIVRRLVEKQGGQISVESAPGAGTTFHLDFRAAPTE